MDQWFEKSMGSTLCLESCHGVLDVPDVPSLEFTRELPDLKNGFKTPFLPITELAHAQARRFERGARQEKERKWREEFILQKFSRH